uniref:ribosomal protein L22 n=1 Tax=Euphorbia tithymaloides TaxID=212310 RepID=UPI002000AEB4|nr:ribosomal protein L22 [Euphorbia tithymaloides]YP_010362702.1 ribosomal protein L22 [Euphorbia tithymaloides]UNS16623.1 ribosomal protein L22 [Euphorbia tithymaloides]UNS16658.1 ribosomal protein L22 [Euphorbia tithymaloides]
MIIKKIKECIQKWINKKRNIDPEVEEYYNDKIIQQILNWPEGAPKIIDQNTKISTLGKHIRMSTNKARRIIDQIRGRSYEETILILELMPYRAAYPILKLIYSAAANASHNKAFNKADLIISKAEVNDGTSVKKLKPQARGRGYLIKKSTCHITIVLRNISLYKKYTSLTIKDGKIYL